MDASRFFRHNGLTLVLATLFLVTWVAQAVTGWEVYNEERVEHGLAGAVAFGPYLLTGHFLEATGENWESEFLQMGLFVLLTACLFQKGSPESHDPDVPEEPEPPITRRSPWPMRAGGWWAVWYRSSLGSTFLLLFFAAWCLHAVGGWMDENEQRLAHHLAGASFGDYLGSARFWFESMQNWQSEFLSLVAMVFLSVYLRQKGSAESKPVTMPHWDQES